jgi:hypothetical protein
MANPRGNAKNLAPAFKPGQSGNPGGSTKGYRDVCLVREDVKAA